MKLSNYIAYDSTLVMMTYSLGQGYIWWSYASFYTWILTRKLNVGYNFAIPQYFVMKLSNCIAYDNTYACDDTKFFTSRSHLMELCTFLYLHFYSDIAPEGYTGVQYTSVQLNTHLVANLMSILGLWLEN
jgi:hypothetical protein